MPREIDKVIVAIKKLVSLLSLCTEKRGVFSPNVFRLPQEKNPTDRARMIKGDNQKLLNEKPDVVSKRRQEVIEKIRKLIENHNSEAPVRLFLPREEFDKAHEEFSRQKEALYKELDALKAPESESSSITVSP